MNQLHSAMLLFTLTMGNAWAAGFEGVSNTTLGQGAGNVAGDAGDSVFIGRSAGVNNTTGYANTFLGAYAGFKNTTGNDNTFFGYSAGALNTTGKDNTFFGYSAGNRNTTGISNTFLGTNAGYFTTTGSGNTFVGEDAGISNYTATDGTFIGSNAGRSNTQGRYNVFIGPSAGYGNTIGETNVALGAGAGISVTGSGNVFLGNEAGYSETGSNRLYISNNATSNPLIFGEFDTKKVILNGNLEVIGPDNGLVRLSDVTTDNTTKGARMVLRHYNNAQLPVYLFGAASTPGQNFVAFGGGNNIGNAATQIDLFTAPTTTTAFGTPRLTVTGNGNVGIGTQSPVHPLQMASGALVTTGGVWTNASSRDYKENIKDLSSKEASLTLASLTPVTYNYKVDKTQAHVGFIAEDVPELVATKNRKGLSPMDIVAVLTKVVQEQQKALQEQQSTITNLAQELKALKQEVRIGNTTALFTEQ